MTERALPALSEREIATINARRRIPIAIVATVDDVLDGAYDRWHLAYDEVGEVMRHQHHHGARPTHVVRRLRVDQPQDMTNGATVPLEERDSEPWETAARKRRAYVSEIADGIVRGEGPGVRLDTDFDLEREVLDELWRRWREVTADGFLSRALGAGA